VAVLRAERYSGDLEGLVVDGLRLVKADVRGRSVVLKPNFVEFLDDHPINTQPALVVAAADALRKLGARSVVVAEGPGHRRDTEAVAEQAGLFEALDDAGLSFVDLNEAPVVRVPLRSRYTGLPELWVPRLLHEADLVVSMPKLKTHHWAGITCSMKNFFGVVPGAVYGWPKNLLHIRGIDASILDLVATVRPALTIVDAIVGMEGDGPIMGTARPVGFLAMGRDLPAVDATCARVIGIDPEEVVYLDAAGHFLGNVRERRIEQRGENPARYRTEFALIESMQGIRLRS
jgi:uncharacterized protein (DUF362 family)